MAGVSDKARHYLEQTVPQLRDFEQKEIFSKDEIRSLVSKRSEFEHRILAPGTKPTDFLSYIEWERSLDRLRAKRCARLHIHNSTSHPSEARTFGIFKRAVQKHPGCVPLWRAYLDFATAVKASKKWDRIVAEALRLHPRNVGLWVLAGRRAAERGDINKSQGYFMRGCGFCEEGEGAEGLWVEFARCMVEWIARRERKAGAGTVKTEKSGTEMKGTTAGVDYMAVDEDEDSDEDEDGEKVFGKAEMILPGMDVDKVETEAAAKKVSEEEATQKLQRIPVAIFDIAKTKRFWGPGAAERFFDLFAGFTKVSCQEMLVQHVLDAMVEMFPNHPATVSSLVRQPLIGVAVNTPAFPKALRESLARLKSGMEKTEDKKALAQKLIVWIDLLLAVRGMDEAIKTVLGHTKKSLEVQAAS